MESVMRVRGANQSTEDGPPSNADDRRAITRCLSGDLDAFTAIVERHQDRLMWTAYHLLGDHEAAASCREVFTPAPPLRTSCGRCDPTINRRLPDRHLLVPVL